MLMSELTRLLRIVTCVVPAVVLWNCGIGFARNAVPGPQQADPPRISNRLQLAERFMQAGESEKALSLYEELYRQSPTPYVYQGYVDCLERLQQYDQAEKIVRRQIRQSQEPFLLYIDLARIYGLQGQTKKLEGILRERIEKTDFLSEGLSVEELAQAIVDKTERYDYAIKVYLKAREQECGSSGSGTAPLLLNSVSEPVRPCRPEKYAFQLAELYRQNGQWASMLDEYGLLLSNEPARQEDVYARLQSLFSAETAAVGRHSETDRKKISQDLTRLLLQRVQKDPDNPVFQEMLVWALLQQKDFPAAVMYAKSYSRRFQDGGRNWFQTIRVAASNQAYETAEEAYREFISSASASSSSEHAFVPSETYVRSCRIDLLNLYFSRLERMNRKDTALVSHLRTAYRRLFAELGPVPESFEMYRNLARIYAYYSAQMDSASLLLSQAIASRTFNNQQKARLKIDLADILLYYGKVWDATLLYSQVEKDFKQDAIGFYAKLQNARLSYYIGEFEWAKSQLDVLKAATSKLIANDAMELSLLIKESLNPDSSYDGLYYLAQADFNEFRHLYATALSLLDTVLAMPAEGALFDQAWYRKARIYLQLEEVDQSLLCLEKIYRDYPDGLLADDALFLSAEILSLRSGSTSSASGAVTLSFPAGLTDGRRREGRSESSLEEDRKQAMELYRRVFTDFRSSSLASPAREQYRKLREQTDLP